MGFGEGGSRVLERGRGWLKLLLCQHEGEGGIGGNGNSFKSHDHVLKSNGCRLKESHPIKEGSKRGSMSHGPRYIIGPWFEPSRAELRSSVKVEVAVLGSRT